MSTSVSLLGALGFGFYYWFANYDTHFTNWSGNPMFQGLVWGLIYGNVALSMQVACTIQLMYIASVAVGANLPADQVLAGIVAIPIALMNNLPADQAIVIAVPFAVMGTAIDNARRMLNGLWNRRAHVEVDKMNLGGLRFCACVGPAIVQLPLRILPVAAIMYFGAGNSETILKWLPLWLSNGFSVVGGMLPCIGMVACTRMIGRKNLLPYFVIGYFLMKQSGVSGAAMTGAKLVLDKDTGAITGVAANGTVGAMPLLTMAIFAGMIAVIHVSIVRIAEMAAKRDDEDDDDDVAEKGEKMALKYATTSRARWITCFKILYMHRIGNCMEYFYGTGVAHAFVPVLKQLYGHDEEAFKESLHRHLAPYISEMTWGNCILGAAVAMEEQRANGSPISGDSINAMKSGLMGPFAGLGDTLNYFIMQPIVRSIFISFGMTGNPIAFICQPLLSIVFNVIGFVTYGIGYNLGRDSLLNILRGGWMNTVMTGAGIMGMFMMGAMSANYVKVGTKLTFVIGNNPDPFNVQKMFDQVVPGLLPFVLTAGAYLYLERGGSNSSLMLILAAAGLVLGGLGILA